MLNKLGRNHEIKTKLLDGWMTLAVIFAIGQRSILGFNSWNPFDSLPLYTIILVATTVSLRTVYGIVKYIFLRKIATALTTKT